MDYHPQQRRFSRIHFDARVGLEQGRLQLTGNLLDISLNGLLTTQPEAGQLDLERPIIARVYLADDISIVMHCRVAHREAHYLGLACVSVDTDSIGHLRRLLELNLSGSNALERELSELIAG